MGERINKNQAGLAVGIFAALFHLIWAILVAAGVAKTYLNWILPLHFVNLLVDIAEFSLVNAVILIIAAFIGGYIAGWVFGLIWNWAGKKR